ncbi:MAG: hypothetical protein C4289_15020, partial [Chloroflexota bacterium]
MSEGERSSVPTGDQSWRGRRIGGMSRREMDAFLQGPWICKVACLKDDGSPYVVPVWYEWDGEGFYLVARKKSAWAAYLQRDPRVMLCIDKDTRPYQKVLVEGRAMILEEPNTGGHWVEIAERMARRYLGEHGLEYLTPTL